jgi:hypothetical protein
MNGFNPKFLFLFIALAGAAYFFSPGPQMGRLVNDNPQKSQSRRKKKKVIKKKKAKSSTTKKPRKLRIYRNLHTGTLSAQEKTSKGWRVTMHPAKVTLKNAKFKVNQTGRRKVLKDKQKNVHAVIEGELVDTKSLVQGEKITYDPYKTSQFMLSSGKKVFEAEVVSVDAKGNIRAKGIV